jgi:ACS family D-galactonate transporter-like MFS transporter
VSLFWGVQVITDVIRVSLAVVAPTLMTLYGISPGTMGLVLSGWQWTYVGFLPLAGPIVDRFGAWMVLGVGSGVWGLATLALPLAGGSVVALFLLRALYGVGHCVRFPAQAWSVVRWFKPNERATAVGLCFSGGQVGLAVGTMISAFMLTQLGWQSVFYVIGFVSLLFTALWLVVYPERKIGRQMAMPEVQSSGDEARVSWSSLWRHRSVWGIILGQLGYLYAYFFFMTWWPSYLMMERHLTIPETGLFASLPFLMGIFGTLGGGWMGDFLIRRGFSRTASRKTMIGTGLTLVTLTMAAAAVAPQTWLSVTLLTLCMGCMRLITASANSAPMDLAPPNLVASLTAIQNSIGTISSLLVAILTGYIVEVTGTFVPALLLAGGMALMGAISYVVVVECYEPLPIKPGAASG